MVVVAIAVCHTNARARLHNFNIARVGVVQRDSRQSSLHSRRVVVGTCKLASNDSFLLTKTRCSSSSSSSSRELSACAHQSRNQRQISRGRRRHMNSQASAIVHLVSHNDDDKSRRDVGTTTTICVCVCVCVTRRVTTTFTTQAPPGRKSIIDRTREKTNSRNAPEACSRSPSALTLLGWVVHFRVTNQPLASVAFC